MAMFKSKLLNYQRVPGAISETALSSAIRLVEGGGQGVRKPCLRQTWDHGCAPHGSAIQMGAGYPANKVVIARKQHLNAYPQSQKSYP